MIASLQNQTYKDGRPLSDLEIAHIMIALLMAGQHTSSATSTWTLLELASRPDVYQAMYDEQVRVVGDGNGGFRMIEYDDLKNVSTLIPFVLALSCLTQDVDTLSFLLSCDPDARHGLCHPRDPPSARPHPLDFPKGHRRHPRPPYRLRPVRVGLVRHPQGLLRARLARSRADGHAHLGGRWKVGAYSMD